MENIPVDKVSAEFWASLAMLGVVIAFVKWMVSEYFKLTSKILEAMVRSTIALEKLTTVVEACLEELGVRKRVT